MKKPKKPTKISITKELLQSLNPRNLPKKINSKTPHPCPNCKGKGNILDPNALPDPAEGYKMATRLPCTTCNSTKYVNNKTFKNFTQPIIHNRLINELKIYHEQLLTYNTIQNILEKCSPIEKITLKQFL